MKKTIMLFCCVCLFFVFMIGSSASQQDLSEELLEQVPIYAYSGKNETIETVQFGTYADANTACDILFKELFRVGLIPEDMNEFYDAPSEKEIASCPKVSVEDVNRIFDQLFGPGASERLKDKDLISTGKLSLHLLEDKENFVYVPYSFAGGVSHSRYTSFVRSETIGKDVLVYARFAEYAPAGYGGFYINANATWKENPAVVLLPSVTVKDYECFDRLENGDYDEYLPVYKHTFKPNGDGTYYWAQTELETAGKEIPLSLIDPSAKEDNTNTSTQGSTNTNTTTDTTSDVTTSEVVSDTSTDTATDVSTNTTTDAVTDVSTGSATDVVPQEEGSSAVWIVVAVVAVAAVAAAAVFFVLKKKKA